MFYWRKPFNAEAESSVINQVLINANRCKGCGFCVEFCPLNALEESQEFNQHGYHFPEMVDPGACVNCEYCQLVCPDFAIWSEIEEEHPD